MEDQNVVEEKLCFVAQRAINENAKTKSDNQTFLGERQVIFMNAKSIVDH
jgi:hypothetical protein